MTVSYRVPNHLFIELVLASRMLKCNLFSRFLRFALYASKVSSSSSDTSRSFLSGAGNISFGDATPGETKRENAVMPSPA